MPAHPSARPARPRTAGKRTPCQRPGASRSANAGARAGPASGARHRRQAHTLPLPRCQQVSNCRRTRRPGPRGHALPASATLANAPAPAGQQLPAHPPAPPARSTAGKHTPCHCPDASRSADAGAPAPPLAKHRRQAQRMPTPRCQARSAIADAPASHGPRDNAPPASAHLANAPAPNPVSTVGGKTHARAFRAAPQRRRP